MKRFYCLWLILCPYPGMAQSPVLKTISPGQQVPAIAFNSIYNYKGAAANLTDFKGKIVLLDFWATWCSACIKKLNLLDSMQATYPSQMQVLLVNTADTRDTKEKIAAFFNRHKSGKGSRLNLPTALNDSIAAAYFPHSAIPHYVWIDKTGKMLAATGPDEVTPQNIQALINDQPPAFAGLGLMDSFNSDLPLFVQGNAGDGAGIRFRSTLSNYIPGMTSFSHTTRTANNLVTQYKIINASLLQLVNSAWSYNGRSDRILFAVSDSLQAALSPATDSAKKLNSYAYEIICPPVTSSAMRLHMRYDLERWFNLAGKYQKQPAPCYLLTVDTALLRQHQTAGAKRSNHLNDPGNRYITNCNLSELASFLDQQLDKPVFQKDSIPYNLDLNLNLNLNLPLTLSSLQALGIRLTPGIENIEQFTIYQLSKQQLP